MFLVTLAGWWDFFETTMGIGDQLGVAILAVLASFAGRRLRVPRQIFPFVPSILSILLVWLFSSLQGLEAVRAGAISGLLASGLLFLLLGRRIE